MKHFFFTALLVQALSLPAQGQWQLTQQHPTAFYGVYGIDAQNLWLSGGSGEYYHSTDGGVQIQVFEIPDNYSFLHDIAVWDDSLLLIGGGCYFPFDQCPGNLVLSAGSDGANWQIKQLDTMPFAIGVIQHFDLHPDGQLYALSDYGGIYYSPDLGQNWTSIPVLPDFSINIFSSVQFIDTQVGYVMGSKYIQPNSHSFRLFKTVNGGLEWTQVLEFVTDASGYQHIFHFLDADTGFVPGDAGIIYKTTDGGQTWMEQQVGSSDEAVHRIQFADNQTGYLTTFNAPLWVSKIYRSANGGQNWSADLQVDSVLFSDLQFYNANSGYAVTHYGHIYSRTFSDATFENDADQPVVIFPNPAEDVLYLNFELSGSTPAQFNLYDAQGRLVLQQNLTARSGTIPCGDLPAGPYFFLLAQENGRSSRGKVILK